MPNVQTMSSDILGSGRWTAWKNIILVGVLMMVGDKLLAGQYPTILKQ